MNKHEINDNAQELRDIAHLLMWAAVRLDKEVSMELMDEAAQRLEIVMNGVEEVEE